MIDYKALIAFRDEMTKIATLTPYGTGTGSWGSSTAPYAKYLQGFPNVPPKRIPQVVIPKNPEVGKTDRASAVKASKSTAPPAPPKQVVKKVAPPKLFKMPKNYQAPTSLRGADYKTRAMYIQSKGYNPRDRKSWQKDKEVAKMMSDWWKNRNKPAQTAPKNPKPASNVSANAGDPKRTSPFSAVKPNLVQSAKNKANKQGGSGESWAPGATAEQKAQLRNAVKNKADAAAASKPAPKPAKPAAIQGRDGRVFQIGPMPAASAVAAKSGGPAGGFDGPLANKTPKVDWAAQLAKSTKADPRQRGGGISFGRNQNMSLMPQEQADTLGLLSGRGTAPKPPRRLMESTQDGKQRENAVSKAIRKGSSRVTPRQGAAGGAGIHGSSLVLP